MYFFEHEFALYLFREKKYALLLKLKEGHATAKHGHLVTVYLTSLKRLL